MNHPDKSGAQSDSEKPPDRQGSHDDWFVRVLTRREDEPPSPAPAHRCAWLVAACRVQPPAGRRLVEALAASPDTIRPSWAWCVVKAINETDAYDLGLDVWDSESMIGQQPNDVLVNWYVAPLPDAKDLHDDVAAMIAAFESRRASINND